MRTLPLGLLLALALPAAGQAPEAASPCGAVNQLCQTTTEVGTSPEVLEVVGDADFEVVVTYTHVPGPAALTAAPATRINVTLTADDLVEVEPQEALVEVAVEHPDGLAVRSVEARLPANLRCLAQGVSALLLRAAAEPNGWLAASEGTAEVEVRCAAPSAAPAPGAASGPAPASSEAARPPASPPEAPRAVPAAPLLLAVAGALLLAGAQRGRSL